MFSPLFAATHIFFPRLQVFSQQTNIIILGCSGAWRKKKEAAPLVAAPRLMALGTNCLSFHECLRVPAALWEKSQTALGIRPVKHSYNELWPPAGGAALARRPNTSTRVDQVGPVQPVGKSPANGFFPPLVASRRRIPAAGALVSLLRGGSTGGASGLGGDQNSEDHCRLLCFPCDSPLRLLEDPGHIFSRGCREEGGGLHSFSLTH